MSRPTHLSFGLTVAQDVHLCLDGHKNMDRLLIKMEKLMALLKIHGLGIEMQVSYTLINQLALVFLIVLLKQIALLTMTSQLQIILILSLIGSREIQALRTTISIFQEKAMVEYTSHF